MNCEEENRVLTAREVAELLGVSRQRVYEMARTGMLPRIKLGRQVRIDGAQLDDFLSKGGKALPGGWRREAA